MMNIRNRFKTAPWMGLKPTIYVLGAGGIGSNLLYNLTKTVEGTYIIQDFDKVEYHNVGTQFFDDKDMGLDKVQALGNKFGYLQNVVIHQMTTKFKEGDSIMPITITGLDNMEARKNAFESWRKLENRELFIDGRMRANLYEVYSVLKGNEEEYEKTLFDSSEIAHEDFCTFKSTAYVGMMIGARITQIVVNHLSNKVANEEICVVPFKVQEFTEIFLIETT